MLKRECFDLTKTISFSNLHDDVITAVHTAMTNANVYSDEFADWDGIKIVGFESREEYTSIVRINIESGYIDLECDCGTVMFNLDVTK